MKLLIAMGVSVISLVVLAAPHAALSKGLTEDAVNGATFSHQAIKRADRTPIMLKLQVLLDRAQFSPGLMTAVADRTSPRPWQHMRPPTD